MKDSITTTTTTITTIRAGEHPAWDQVFALRPEIDRIEIECWDVGDGAQEYDLHLFYQDRSEGLSFSAIRQGVLKELVAEAWYRTTPDAFEE